MPIYLRYGKIKGEVKDPAPYRGWIELESLQWGLNRPISSPTGTSGSGSTPSVSEIVVTKEVDSISPLLQQEALVGEGVGAVIDFVKDGHVYLRCTLTGTMISSYSFAYAGRKYKESMLLNFQKVEYKQTPGGPPPPP